MKKVICVMGPTACGKTAYASDLVKQGSYEIISVDSAMIYRDMDIGTATPTSEELAVAPHRLINVCDPAEKYSVGQFCRDACREIDEIHAKGNIPLLVGGTMMYFHQLQRGYSELPESDGDVRDKIRLEAEALGWPAMHARLASIDPKTAQRLEPNDQQRISRALEIYAQTGQTLSAWHAEQTQSSPEYEFENVIIAPYTRAEIHERIAKRFDQMLEQGFIDEVEALYRRDDLHQDLPSIRCVGYRQAWSYLDGVLDYATMRDKAIIATRQLCKRQFTWLRQWQE